MITKDDDEVFGDWCQSELKFYDAVVCLDGSSSPLTHRIAQEYPNAIVYLHENDQSIAHRTDHGLRHVVHEEIVRLFGQDNWIMCCHADEFCYHDPRRIVALAEEMNADLVSWYSPHFYPHPSELASLEHLYRLGVPNRFRHFHWGYMGTDRPWIEDRLYRNSQRVQWDGVTQGSVRPHGILGPAPFHPILMHYKVCSLNSETYENIEGHALYANHWTDQGNYRTGLPFAVAEVKDLFVDRIPKYSECSRFDGSFLFPWNMGDDFRGQAVVDDESFASELSECHDLINRGAIEQADAQLLSIRQRSRTARTKSIVCNNIGVVNVIRGSRDEGRLSFRAAAALDRDNLVARQNLEALDGPRTQPRNVQVVDSSSHAALHSPTRIAIFSLLFNWPSTGGGTVHTKELAEFLLRAGFDMLHVIAQYDAWGVGRCNMQSNVQSEVLRFDDAEWNLESVIARFHSAATAFKPDCVIITDSWNFKPWLAEAARPFPFALRYQALENLCPLNNIRLLPDAEGRVKQCTRHQLATPHLCHECCRINERFSGQLHQIERQFSRVGTAEYDAVLRRSIADAEAVLVVNPLMQAMFSPWNEQTIVVPSGMDGERFVKLDPVKRATDPKHRRTRILFAGLVDEYMKGFHVLREACNRIWSKRQDFELVVTGDPSTHVPEYATFLGWLDQESLATEVMSSDILVFPTIAQEALGRTAVEAMAAGIPVIASRIGGLPFTVVDNYTGLLVTPGDPTDLAAKIVTLLSNDELRRKLGENGRRRFNEEYSWPVIIDRHYRPLFSNLKPRNVTSPPA